MAGAADFLTLPDAWYEPPNQPPLRFRTGFGGMSPRARNALILVAEAIRLDNEQSPQHRPNPSAELS